MGRDGALLPYRSHGESSPASRSYDKTSQLDSHRCFRLPSVHFDSASDFDVLSFDAGQEGDLFTDDAGGIQPVKVWFG